MMLRCRWGEREIPVSRPWSLWLNATVVWMRVGVGVGWMVGLFCVVGRVRTAPAPHAPPQPALAFRYWPL